MPIHSHRSKGAQFRVITLLSVVTLSCSIRRPHTVGPTHELDLISDAIPWSSSHSEVIGRTLARYGEDVERGEDSSLFLSAVTMGHSSIIELPDVRLFEADAVPPEPMPHLI